MKQIKFESNVNPKQTRSEYTANPMWILSEPPIPQPPMKCGLIGDQPLWGNIEKQDYEIQQGKKDKYEVL